MCFSVEICDIGICVPFCPIFWPVSEKSSTWLSHLLAMMEIRLYDRRLPALYQLLPGILVIPNVNGIPRR
jgi:hypothetical protein